MGGASSVDGAEEGLASDHVLLVWRGDCSVMKILERVTTIILFASTSFV